MVPILVLCVLIFSIIGFFLFKQNLKASKPAHGPPILQQETSTIDLRPAGIAKLQQLIRNGSDSLYQLQIDSLVTEIPSGTIILKGIHAYPDSNRIQELLQLRRLPDDVFEISAGSLRISGITLGDLLHERRIHLNGIECLSPDIKVWHRLQAFNADKRERAKGQSIYSRIHQLIDGISIDSLSILHGNLYDLSMGSTRIYKDISVLLHKIRIDSVADADSSRFLFAKHAILKAGKMMLASKDSRYDLSIGGISIDGEAHELNIHDLSLMPHNGKDAMEQQLKRQSEIFEIKVPQLSFKGINWWATVHRESLLTKQITATDASIYVYLDKRKPARSVSNKKDFPQQLLMGLGLPVSVETLTLKNAGFVYEEYTKKTDKQSSFRISQINATANGITNMKRAIAANPLSHFRARGIFMDITPIDGEFVFELSPAKRGAFSAMLKIGQIEHEEVNPFSEAMGMIRFTDGQLQQAVVMCAGNNDNIHGSIAPEYTKLRIAPLKAVVNAEGKQRKRELISLVANAFVIKHDNPGLGGAKRVSTFSRDRSTEGNFFNFMWMSIKSGFLKNVGIPVKLGM